MNLNIYDTDLYVQAGRQAGAHTHMHACRHTHTHMTSRNRVLILVWVEILWEEEGFQLGFKRWQGWAVPTVLLEWIPNVGSKAREGAKAMGLAFVLLDFQHAGVRRRAQCTRWSVDMQQFREVSRTRTIYSTETRISLYSTCVPVRACVRACTLARVCVSASRRQTEHCDS